MLLAPFLSMGLATVGYKQEFFQGLGDGVFFLRPDRSSCGRCISHGASWTGCQFALGSSSGLSTYVQLFALVLLMNYYM